MQISGVSLALTWPHRLCLLRVLLCWGRWHCTRFLRPACLFTAPFGSVSSPLSCGVFLSPLLLQAFPLLITRWHCCSCQPLCLFTVHIGSGSSPVSCRVFLCHSHNLSRSQLLGACPFSHGSLSGQARLVYLQFQEGFPSPSLRRWVCPTLFPACLFCSYCLLLSFSFFPGWGLVCPGGYADLAQACLWEYRVPLSSPCPHLPKPYGCGQLAARGPSWFLH
jgi:hypothetical protein